MPFNVASGDQLCGNRFALNDDAMRTRCADDQIGLGIINTFCQFSRSEPAKNNRVNDPEAGTSQHRNHRFGDHRHIDDHTIPFGQPIFL